MSSVVLCTAGYDHTIKFWEAPSGVCSRTVPFSESQVNCLSIGPRKQLLAAAGNPQAQIFDIPSGNHKPIISLDGHTHNVTAVGFQKDRKWMYTGSEDGTVKIWDIRQQGGYRRDYQSRAPVNTVALHPNQGEIISGDDDGFVRVWDLTANRCSFQIQPDGRCAIRSISIAADASLVVAANSKGTVFVWKLGKGGFEPLHKIDAHNTYILKILMSPDSEYFATTSADKTIKIWSVENNFQLQQTLVGHRGWVWDCSFSADSAYLVTTSSDKTGKLWNLKTWEVVLDYAGHHKALTSVALNDSSVSYSGSGSSAGSGGGAGGPSSPEEEALRRREEQRHHQRRGHVVPSQQQQQQQHHRPQAHQQVQQQQQDPRVR